MMLTRNQRQRRVEALLEQRMQSLLKPAALPGGVSTPRRRESVPRRPSNLPPFTKESKAS